MKSLCVMVAGACVLAWAVACRAQDSCPVTAHGAKGDCKTDDTAAFQDAADKCGSFYIPRQEGKCYRVNGVRLQAGVTVTFQDRNTELWPVSAETHYIFSIEGKAVDAKIRYTTIRNGELWAPFTMARNTAGIRIYYGDHIRL